MFASGVMQSSTVPHSSTVLEWAIASKISCTSHAHATAHPAGGAAWALTNQNPCGLLLLCRLHPSLEDREHRLCLLPEALPFWTAAGAAQSVCTVVADQTRATISISSTITPVKVQVS
jgi:hypothetical protein